MISHKKMNTQNQQKITNLIKELSMLWKEEERYWIIEWEAQQERRELEKISWGKLTELQEVSEMMSREVNTK